ncbi:lactate racemase domain-containing protein [Alteribacillus sp. HJP-4]|uniref:lactate racemase domain-containing protein n=1 Tax=Alteribacillus sp. HJP-4 TaxID=2775394 RepID=UPI0035CD2E60
MEQLFNGIHIPRMQKVRQSFARERVSDIAGVLQNALNQEKIIGTINTGDRVAIAVGSRGIANLPQLISEVITAVKERGAEPFIVPAMGSHGGATEAGQAEVLAELGVTEAVTGVPVVSNMDVVQLGVTESGFPVYIDKEAYHADAVIITGRIKPHTSFRAKFESGLAKMIAVGLGKQKGAEMIHEAGVDNIAERVEEAAKMLLDKSNIVFSVGVLENAYEETAEIAVLPGDKIMKEEPVLLEKAKQLMPSILFSPFDVLIVDEMGKNISGNGMDPNIIRRNYSGSVKHEPLVQRIAILDLTKESHGNANGMTNADICSRRFFDKIQFAATYPNPLTNKIAQGVKIPMVMENDSLAIKAAMKTCFDVDYSRMRIIRIKNTLELEYIYISEAMLDEAQAHPEIEPAGDLDYMTFDQHYNLF